MTHLRISCVIIMSVYDDSGRSFLNNLPVRRALHVDQVPNVQWQTCFSIDYTTTIPDERPMYRTLIANMRVLIYNGDADGSNIQKYIMKDIYTSPLYIMNMDII